jgi:hypothetical protein
VLAKKISTTFLHKNTFFFSPCYSKGLLYVLYQLAISLFITLKKSL